MADYPEHKKLKALNGANQIVGDFIEWLGEQGLVIAHYPTLESGAQSVNLHWCGKSRDTLLAEHFGVDQSKLDEEKDKILEDFRAASEAKASA